MDKPEEKKTEKQMVRLEDWRLAHVGGQKVLFGKLFGHDIIRDGSSVNTATLVRFDANLREAESIATFYKLGKKEGE